MLFLNLIPQLCSWLLIRVSSCQDVLVINRARLLRDMHFTDALNAMKAFSYPPLDCILGRRFCALLGSNLWAKA